MPEGGHDADDSASAGGGRDAHADGNGGDGDKPGVEHIRVGGDSAAGKDAESAEVLGDDDASASQPGNGDAYADAGVDAWLISYNRRLKKELERLRGRARQAEEG